MEKRAQQIVTHQTDDIASDIHAIKLKKFLYPKKKLNVANRKSLLQLLKQLEINHPLSRVIEFPQYHEARKHLARLAQKHKLIS
jgi:hypothetical protein